jgi:glucose-6-phosphate 1-dehydrogenase
MKNFVIFGATGDLSKNFLIPSLHKLYQKGHVFNYFGFGRSSSIPFSTPLPLKYFSGPYTTDGFSTLASNLTPDSIYYLALPTSYQLVSNIVDCLLAHQLFTKGVSRLVIEKPFGEDEKSAQKLITLLDQKIGRESVFLVDHYLTKELVRNIISLRFANPVFNHLWNGQFIEAINITTIEDRGIGTRAQYYDHIGEIRDMVQNHCLQLLALITMDRPDSISYADFVLRKKNVFDHLILFSDFTNSVKTGQYRGYKNEVGVDPVSTTETYAQIKLKLDTPSWQSVPLTITTGKKMTQKLTQIEIIFRPKVDCLWGEDCATLAKNKLIINLFPDNNIKFIINSEFNIHKKLPTPSILMVGAVDPSMIAVNAYENVIVDIVDGNQLNTPSFDEIIRQWQIIDAISSHPDFGKNIEIY